MNNITEIINALPVPTWNHLGVNGARKPEYPAPTKDSNANIFYILSDGMTVKDVAIDGTADKALEDFIAQNKNAELSINIDKSVYAPLYLKGILDTKKDTFAECVKINVEENTKTTINHSIESDTENTGYYSSIIKVKAGKNSQVKIVLVQLLSDAVNSWASLVVDLEENAHVEVVRVLLGSDKTYVNVTANLIGDNSHFALSTYYAAKNNQLIDINDVAKHIGKHTDTDMYIAGILDNNASKIYRGTIDFQKGAEKSTGKEIDDVLLMSETVHNRTCPLILCGEETVAGEHAATIGRFNDAQLFYLCSRGLTIDQAKQLLVDAKLHSVVGKIEDKDLATKIIAFAKNEEPIYD